MALLGTVIVSVTANQITDTMPGLKYIFGLKISLQIFDNWCKYVKTQENFLNNVLLLELSLSEMIST